MFFKKCLYLFAKSVTLVFGLGYSGFNPGSENESIHYFCGFGPKIIIFNQGKEVVFLGNALSVIVEKNKGKFVDCKFAKDTVKTGEKIIFGNENVYKKYKELMFLPVKSS